MTTLLINAAGRLTFLQGDLWMTCHVNGGSQILFLWAPQRTVFRLHSLKIGEECRQNITMRGRGREI